jgi:hypothetical protein
MRRIILGLAVCLIALWSPMALRATAAGPSAPAFELVTLTGKSYSRDSLKGPTLLSSGRPGAMYVSGNCRS